MEQTTIRDSITITCFIVHRVYGFCTNIKDPASSCFVSGCIVYILRARFCAHRHYSCIDTVKKNDNFTRRIRRTQGTCGHLPSRRAVATAQCPHAPVTMHYNTCGRCRDALPGHYLCCSSQDKCNARPSAQDGGGHQSRRAGGASLCRGTPALHRAMLGRQFSCNVKSKVIIE